MSSPSFWRPYSMRTAAAVRRLIPDLTIALPLAGDLTIEASLKKHVYVWRRSRRDAEVATARKIATLAGETGVIFDLGANIGLYSLVFAANRRRTVHAFEPFSEPLSYLRRNIAHNRLHNVHVHPIVLSDRRGTCRFTLDRVTLCTSHISAEGEDGVEMDCSDLDSYVQRMKLPIPDVVKIDVEGADLAVLKGMEQLLRGGHPRVFLEGGLRNETGEIPSISYLESLGYVVKDLDLNETLRADTSEYAFVALPPSPAP